MKKIFKRFASFALAAVLVLMMAVPAFAEEDLLSCGSKKDVISYVKVNWDNCAKCDLTLEMTKGGAKAEVVKDVGDYRIYKFSKKSYSEADLAKLSCMVTGFDDTVYNIDENPVQLTEGCIEETSEDPGLFGASEEVNEAEEFVAEVAAEDSAEVLLECHEEKREQCDPECKPEHEHECKPEHETDCRRYKCDKCHEWHYWDYIWDWISWICPCPPCPHDTLYYAGECTLTYKSPIPVEDCIVTFDMQGHGKQVDPQTVKNGETAAEPTAPYESKWQFGGWYNEATCETKYDFNTPVTNDITLYAKWTYSGGGGGGGGTSGGSGTSVILTDAPAEPAPQGPVVEAAPKTGMPMEYYVWLVTIALSIGAAAVVVFKKNKKAA